MKTFIFLLIIIIAFFSYIFKFSPSGSNNVQNIQSIPTEPVTQMTDLESFEKSVYAKVKKKPILTSQNLEAIANLTDEKPQPISDQMTFDLLKQIIKQVNQHYPQQLITLNTPMHSLIRTQEQKALFKEQITASFGIDTNKVDQYMQKNRLLWDWVNVLQ